MSDPITITDPFETIETEYGLDIDMTMEEYLALTDDQRIAFWESIRAMLEAKYTDDSEEAAAETGIQQIFDDYCDDLEDIQDNLEDMIEAGHLTSDETTTAEEYLAMLEEYITLLSDDIDGEMSSGFGEWEEENIDATDGETVTVSPDEDIEEGTNIVVDATRPDETETADTVVDDPHPDWACTDGDGYGEVDPCLDSEGRPTIDVNEDGEINELDLQDTASDEVQTINIDIPDDTDVDYVSYDSETGELVLRCTQTNDDGTTTVYYITILLDPGLVAQGLYNIVFTNGTGGLTQEELETWPGDILKLFYESPNTQADGLSFYYLMNGESGFDDATDYFTRYYMSDESNNLPLEEPSSEDFENGRDYEIYCENGEDDSIDIDVPEGADVDFEVVDENTIIITVTDSSGRSVTYTIHNFQWGADGGDTININNGNITAFDIGRLDFTNMASDGSAYYWLWNYITWNDTTLADVLSTMGVSHSPLPYNFDDDTYNPYYSIEDFYENVETLYGDYET